MPMRPSLSVRFLSPLLRRVNTQQSHNRERTAFVQSGPGLWCFCSKAISNEVFFVLPLPAKTLLYWPFHSRSHWMNAATCSQIEETKELGEEENKNKQWIEDTAQRIHSQSTPAHTVTQHHDRLWTYTNWKCHQPRTDIIDNYRNGQFSYEWNVCSRSARAIKLVAACQFSANK